jgi:hypothetical protein
MVDGWMVDRARGAPHHRMVKSARAALMALHLSGVVFRRRWKPPRLKHGRVRSLTLPGSCRKRRTWRRADGRNSGDGVRGSASGARLGVLLRRMTKWPKRRTVQRWKRRADGKLKRSWDATGYPPIKTSKPRWGKRTSFDGEISHCLLPHPTSAFAPESDHKADMPRGRIVPEAVMALPHDRVSE